LTRSGDAPLAAQKITSGSFTVNDLAAGDWNVKIQNANNSCSADLGTVRIDAAPPALTLSLNSSPSSCIGESNGSITATAGGGAGGYQYSKNGGASYQSSNIFSGLAAGSYTITMKDANNVCTKTSTITINSPTAVSLSLSSSSMPSGYGLSDGQIVVSVSGGNTTSYTFSLDGGGFSTNGSRTFAVAAGNHTIIAKDGNGCSSNTLTVTIDQPPALSLSGSVSQGISCNGYSDGQITATASGGTNSGYQYRLNPGTFQLSNSFSGLAAGAYTVEVKDSNGNTASAAVTVIGPAVLGLSSVKTDVSCKGGSDGTVTLTAAGGTLPYTYFLDGIAQTSGGSITFSGKSAGSYSILVKDSKGCEAGGADVSLSEPAALTLSASQQDVLCHGLSTGRITLTAGGGTLPYRYSINNGTDWSAGTEFINLPAGSYPVVIKDASGCTQSSTVTISQPDKLILSVDNIIHAPCYGTNGNISVSSTGGTGVISYSAVPALSYAGGAFIGAPAGTYTLMATDENGCTATSSVTISQPDDLVISSDVSVVSCKGGNDGKVVLHATGGPTGTIEYILTDGVSDHRDAADNTFMGLAAGTYTFKVKRGVCQALHTVTVGEPAALVLSESHLQRVSTFGGSDGSFEIVAAGGNEGYTYAVNGADKETQTSYTGLSAGPYRVKVTDAKGCTREIYVVVTEPNMLVLKLAEKKDVSCYRAADASIEVAAEGGNEGYRYSIDGTNFQSGGKFSNLSGGSYLLTVKDALGYAGYLAVNIHEPDLLTMSHTAADPVCYGGSDGAITINVRGGTRPYSYNWISHPLLGDTANPTHLNSDIYQVWVSDANGCSIQQRIELKDPGEIRITGIRDTILCKGQEITYHAGNPGLRYQWSSDKGFSSTAGSVQLSQAGNYKLTVTNAVNCSVSRTFKITESTTLLKADFLQSSVATAGDTVMLVDVSKPTPAQTRWILPAGAVEVGSNASGTVRQVVYNSPGTYTTMMTVGLGECADAIQKTISILPKGQNAEVKDALGYKEGLIKTFKLYPNPTTGNFKVLIELSRKENIRLRLTDFVRNQPVETRQEGNKNTYEPEFNRPELLSGVYVLSLEVAGEVKMLKLIKL
jgi:hypothetical protein